MSDMENQVDVEAEIEVVEPAPATIQGTQGVLYRDLSATGDEQAVQDLTDQSLPAPSKQPQKITPVVKGKIRVVDRSQQDQFASFVGDMNPVTPHVPDPVLGENGEMVHAPADAVVTPVAPDEGFAGFAIPPGGDRVMLMLHPTKDEKGVLSVPPQLVMTVDSSAWVWVKAALEIAMSQGWILSQDGTTVLKGFTCQLLARGGEVKDMAFPFKQIAAAIPFRDVWEAHERAKAETARKAKVAAKAKKLVKAKRRASVKARSGK